MKYLSIIIMLVCPFLGATPSAYAENHDAGYLDAVGYLPNGYVDPWSFYVGECTSYVAYRLNRDGIPFSNYYMGIRWSNAINWKNRAEQLGLEVTKTPQRGAIAWFKYGHVAYVKSVQSGKAVIAEYNYSPPYGGQYSTRTTTADAYIIASESSSGTPKLVVNGYEDIRNGDSSPSSNDGTYFTVRKSRTATFYFAVCNRGGGKVRDLSVRLKNADSGFQISRKPKDTIPPNTYSSLIVDFSDRRTGTYYAEVYIRSNDSRNDPYTFKIKVKVTN